MVAGFQGLHAPTNRVTTLGRGGSDTSAVALAAAIYASAATSTPTLTASIRPIRASCRRRGRLDKVSFEEMLEMASLGAKVLQVRWVMVHKIKLYVAPSFFDDPADPQLGTSIATRRRSRSSRFLTGIAFSRDEAQITLRERQARRRAVAGGRTSTLHTIIQVVSEGLR